jgi:geranylgeranyl pyrophosphate synthase
LFDRDFSTEGLTRLLGLGSDLPREHVERVLLEPASEFLARAGKAFRARLVEIGWALGGETEPVPVALPMALEILHAGSLIVDDIQDGSSHRRGSPALHRTIGTPLALNVGNWLYFWPFALIEELGLPPERELEVRRRITRVLSAAHFGQALDIGVPVHELDPGEVMPLVRSVSQLKTGRLMQLALSIGPAAAGASPERVAALERFGMALGVGLQMLDDLGNLIGVQDPTKRHEDIRLGRPTWAWAWLADRLDPARFEALRRASREVAASGEGADALAQKMREHLEGSEPARVHAHLESAFDGLQDALGAEVKLTELRALIARLESSYV